MFAKACSANSHVRIPAHVLERIPEIGSHDFTLYAIIKNHENYKTGRSALFDFALHRDFRDRAATGSPRLDGSGLYDFS
jgi:hypothetical protein